MSGVPCFTAEVDGLRRDDDSTVRVHIASDSGVIARMEGASLIELQELETGVALPDALFTWSGPVDSTVED